MTFPTAAKDSCFTPFEKPPDRHLIPEHFSLMTAGQPHPLCAMAAAQLQQHLDAQNDWQHNFGLSGNIQEGSIIGKMFGVLVVSDEAGAMGYLSAFSGKLAGGNHHAKFVPPVFDLLTDNSFLNKGMEALTRINQEIKDLHDADMETNKEKIAQLKAIRKKHSHTLQNKIYNHYHFGNQAGISKSLREIFDAATYKNPPSGAGECAGPKLLQYAFAHRMKPLALAEFWWGQSPKSATWKHGQFYPCCREKCAPILAHMLAGITIE